MPVSRGMDFPQSHPQVVEPLVDAIGFGHKGPFVAVNLSERFHLGADNLQTFLNARNTVGEGCER